MNAIDFDSIDESKFIESLDEAISIAQGRIKDFVKTEITPETINEYEMLADELEKVENIFSALKSANCTKAIESQIEEFMQKTTRFNNEMMLNKELFEKMHKVWEEMNDAENKDRFSTEELRIIDKIHRQFKRAGALLSDEDKAKFEAITEELSSLRSQFSENVRKATDEFALVIDDPSKLEGIPETVVEQAAADAEEAGHKGKWVFTLFAPSYVPFVMYCKDRELRKEISNAFNSRCNGGKYDNKEVALKYIRLSHEKAKLLGYESFADFALEERMAKVKSNVEKLLNEVHEKSRGAAEKEFNKLKKLMLEDIGSNEIKRYDSPYYTEKLKMAELDFDDNTLRPYFKLENVVEGMFEVANKLYGVSLSQIEAPVYHPDVKVYKVEENGKYIGLLYTDFFPRKEKVPGAWMTELRMQSSTERPFISIVCNFTKPTKTKPSLLTLSEVETLFHEFGHALHGLLSKCNFKYLSGANVAWDFVELPSQIFENWVSEKEVLNIIAKHYETGEVLPDELIEKVKKNKQFMEGLLTLRQVSFGFLDMAWYGEPIPDDVDLIEYENKVMTKYDLFPREADISQTCSFKHIFSGYSAGYYSYKWSEVLDADAFELFKEKGVFNKEVAQSFKENILEKGDSEDPEILYERFRGRKPTVDALIKRAGFVV